MEKINIDIDIESPEFKRRVENLNLIYSALKDQELRKNLDLYITEEEFDEVMTILKENDGMPYTLFCSSEFKGENLLTKPQTIQEFMEVTPFVVSKTRLSKMSKENARNALIEKFGEERKEEIEKMVEESCKTGDRRLTTKYNKYPEEIRQIYIERDITLDVMKEELNNKTLTQHDYNILEKDINLFYDAIASFEKFRVCYDCGMNQEYFEPLMTEFEKSLDEYERFVEEYDKEFLKLQIEENSKESVLKKIKEFKAESEKTILGAETKAFQNQLFKAKRKIEEDTNYALGQNKQASKYFKEFLTKNSVLESFRASLGEESENFDFAEIIDKKEYPKIKENIEKDKNYLSEYSKQFNKQDKRFRKIKTDFEEIEKHIKIYELTPDDNSENNKSKTKTKNLNIN